MKTPPLLRQLASPPREYRPVAFWFLNHRLEREEIVRQVREMAAKGMGGFMCHGRDGLRSGYLKEEWRDALATAIEEAEKHGMQVWLYDENHYPSGMAGDLLPARFPDRTMKTLAVLWEGVFEEGQAVEAEAQKPALEFIAVAGSLENPATADLSPRFRQGRLSWKVPAGWGRTAVLVLGEVPWPPSPGHKFTYYPDYLDPELTDEFIELTHRWYFDAFGKRFGKTVRGIFSDNSCGNFGHIRRGIPWGRDFERRFNQTTGSNLRKILPALFYATAPGARRARLVYWRFFGQAYLAAYFGRIKKYCDQVGLYSTGHLCLEDGMGEHARQIGDYFEVMRNFSMTAVDQLGPREPGDPLTVSCGENLGPCLKNTSSAARFTGSPRVMCESFGLASGPWALDLFEMKRISGWMVATGVDLFVPHGLYYSIGGSRKWECTPDHLHNPLWSYYSAWTDWIGRLSTAAADGANCAEVAVLYPIHSLRAALEVDDQTSAAKTALPETLNLQGTPPPSGRGAETDSIEATYHFTINALLREHIDFEVIDEVILATGRVAKSGELKIPAPRKRDATFRIVILPAMTVLEKKSLPLLEKFVRFGGTVVFLNAVPSHTFDPAKGTLQANPGLLEGLGSPVASGANECRRFWEKAAGAGTMRFLGIPPLGEMGSAAEWLAAQLLDRIKRNLHIQTDRGTGPEIITRAWKKGGHRFYYAFNHSREAVAGLQVRVNDPGPLAQLDLTTGELHAWDPKSPVQMDPAEGLLLVAGAKAGTRARSGAVRTPFKTVALAGGWEFQTDRPNVLPLKQWTTEARDHLHLHRMTFDSEIDLPGARLLLDLERSNPELDAHTYGPRLTCLVNGRAVKGFGSGTYLDRNIYEVELTDSIRRGTNLVEIRAAACLIDWEYRLWPPMIVGNFSVQMRNGPPVLSAPLTRLETGSWTTQGHRFFAGEGWYTRSVSLPTLEPGEILLLDLGQVANACRVLVDDQEIGVRIGPPWSFDITGFAGKTIRLTVKTANTPHNLFMDQPRPAGLLGPVVMKRVAG